MTEKDLKWVLHMIEIDYKCARRDEKELFDGASYYRGKAYGLSLAYFYLTGKHLR